MFLSIDIEVLSSHNKDWVTVVENDEHLSNLGAHLATIVNTMPLKLPAEIKIVLKDGTSEEKTDA